MMEIGSFIELQLASGREYFPQVRNIARLNSGRAALWHAFRLLNCSVIWLPYYQCDSVKYFFLRKKVTIKYYYIDRNFDPIALTPASDEAVMLVNYFGIMSDLRMRTLAARYAHVIVDHSQGFFAKPLPGCMNVYSCRKFIGVPDGAYVVGDHAERYTEEYPRCCSSDTALFLLQRIEYGCEGKTYTSRMQNEHRIDVEDIMGMSKLTHSILDGIDYGFICTKRRENFAAACELFGSINQLDPTQYYNDDCVPMVYPLVVEDDTLLERLLQAKHYQGHWWGWLLKELSPDYFEYWLSRYVIPITIDQRYGIDELKYIQRTIHC